MTEGSNVSPLTYEGVSSVELGARWEKTSGDLTGDESVELRLSQSQLDGSELHRCRQW